MAMAAIVSFRTCPGYRIWKEHPYHHSILLQSSTCFCQSPTCFILRKKEIGRGSIRLKALKVNAEATQREDEEIIRERIQKLAESLILPSDFLKQLPNDLRTDLNDAAFALANGNLVEECGKTVGKVLQELSRSWENADTQGLSEIAKVLPSMQSVFLNSDTALGNRLVKCGRYLASTGQYRQGELQKISKALISLGEVLSKTDVEKPRETAFVSSQRVLKFGNLEVQLTSGRAYTGALAGLMFGFFSWQLTSAIQSYPENPLAYANDNAYLVTSSLRGALLALCYGSTILSTFATLGLIVLGIQLSLAKK